MGLVQVVSNLLVVLVLAISYSVWVNYGPLFVVCSSLVVSAGMVVVEHFVLMGVEVDVVGERSCSWCLVVCLMVVVFVVR